MLLKRLLKTWRNLDFVHCDWRSSCNNSMGVSGFCLSKFKKKKCFNWTRSLDWRLIFEHCSATVWWPWNTLVFILFLGRENYYFYSSCDYETNRCVVIHCWLTTRTTNVMLISYVKDNLRTNQLSQKITAKMSKIKILEHFLKYVNRSVK